MPKKAGPHALNFILITVLIDTIGFGIIGPILPDLLAELGTGQMADAALSGGWLLSIYALMAFLFAPVIGNLSDRFGRRPVLVLSLGALAIDYIIMGFAGSLWVLFLGRALAGAAGAVHVTANAFIADISTEENRAQNFGMIGAAWGLGFIIGPIIGGVLGEIDIRLPFFVAAGLAALNMLYGFFVLPESLAPENRRKFELPRANPVGAILQIRHYALIPGMLVAILFFQIAHDANPAIWSFYVREKFDWTAAQVGYSMAAVGVSMVFVMAVLIRRVIPVLGEAKTAYVGLFVMAVGFVAFGSVTEGWMLYAVIPLWSLMGLAMPALRGIMTAQVPANAQGELQGAISSVQGLTAIVAPFIMTRTFHAFTEENAPVYFPGAPFVLAGAMAFIALILVWRLLRRPAG